MIGMPEDQIALWRSYLQRRKVVAPSDIAELEDHLREGIASLGKAGLSAEEAFLVAAGRMGALDAVCREFAREHSDRLWKQLVAEPGEKSSEAAFRRDAVMAFALALLAAIAVKLPVLFGLTPDGAPGFYFRNAGFFVLPPLVLYFAWKRAIGKGMAVALVAVFAAGLALANGYRFAAGGATEILTGLHLPILLWLAVGAAYAGSRWRAVAGRMDFIRFSGELFIYYVLIALGGVVTAAFTAMIFKAAGIKVDVFLSQWLVPCGAAGAVIVAAWLVEAKQSVIENMAPVLARLFTPLFTAVLLGFLTTLVITGRGLLAREQLIGFDLLLVLVLGLMLYAISARDAAPRLGLFDFLQLILVVSALVVDGVMLWAIAARIREFGFTPNRIAALGENLVLLGNLAWSAFLYLSFVRRRAPFADLERWQTDYLPIFGLWPAIVVVVFPPLFGGI